MAKRSNDSSDIAEKLRLTIKKARSFESKTCWNPDVCDLLSLHEILYEECSRKLHLVKGRREMDLPDVHASTFDITSYVDSPMLNTQEKLHGAQDECTEKLLRLRCSMRTVGRIARELDDGGVETANTELMLRQFEAQRIDTNFYVENWERDVRSLKTELAKLRVIKVKLDFILCCLKQEEQG
ncbi:hypothetical protein H2200_010918 [Cladophialophora chaetospira]|uniref:Uncharacterized protein n=1 Tax=Cladophialophora chaetospira TaxID=386627 RepID=A0AA38X0Z4_9EURO|nr:hypothetical protein H2200_010918 [Cladophialophora chaetospira]